MEPNFFYESAGHSQTYARLSSEVQAARGVYCLTGEPGVGKTTLLCVLAEQLRADGRLVFFLSYPPETFDAFLTECSEQFVAAGDADLIQFKDVDDFALLLRVRLMADEASVLILDQMQATPSAVLEDLGRLLSFQEDGQQLLHVFLAGRPELETLLSEPEWGAISSAITARSQLGPMEPHEVRPFIRHWLRTAGYEDTTILSIETINEIVKLSKGVPGRLNALCGQALLDAGKQSTTLPNAEQSVNPLTDRAEVWDENATDNETDLEVAGTHYSKDRSTLTEKLGRRFLRPWSVAVAVVVGLAIGSWIGSWVSSTLERLSQAKEHASALATRNEELLDVLRQKEQAASEELARRTDLEREVGALSSQLATAARRTTELEDAETLSEQLARVSAEFEEANASRQTLTERLDNTMQRTSALEQEKTQLRSILAQREQTESEALQRRADLEREVEALHSQLATAARRTTELEDAKETLSDQLARVSAEFEEADASRQTLTERLDNTMQRTSALEQEKTQLRSILAQREQTESEALQRRADLEREVEALRSQLDVAARSAAEAETGTGTTGQAEIAVLDELEEREMGEQPGLVLLEQEAMYPVDPATAHHETPKEDAVVFSSATIGTAPLQVPGETEVRNVRDEQALIDNLLAKAASDVRELRLTTPAGNNALESYQTILDLQPDNPLAQEGLSRIVARYAQLAQQSLANGEFARAERLLRRADSIQPNTEATMRIRQQMAETGVEIREQDGRFITNKVSSPLKVAIFPFASSGTCSKSVDPEILEAATELVRNDPLLVLTHSFYWDDRRKRVVREAADVWKDEAPRKAPDIDAVYDLGEKLGVDGVLMSWIECSSESGSYEEWLPFEVYLFDTKKQQIHYNKDLLSNLSTGTGKVIIDFVNERTQNNRTR